LLIWLARVDGSARIACEHFDRKRAAFGLPALYSAVKRGWSAGTLEINSG
jgi:hypothetical protein